MLPRVAWSARGSRGSSDPAALAVSHGPGGLMSYTSDAAMRPSTDAQGAATQGHPRGRGFSILSRLARGEAAPAGTTAQQAAPEAAPQPAPEAAPQADPVEWTAPVIPFDRTQPTPRHRRDDADVEAADFDVSVVAVARRSS